MLEPYAISKDAISTNTGINVSSLPDEVLLNILSHLSQYKLYKVAALVCIKWLQLSRDPMLPKKVTIKGGKYIGNSKSGKQSIWSKFSQVRQC